MPIAAASRNSWPLAFPADLAAVLVDRVLVLVAGLRVISAVDRHEGETALVESELALEDAAAFRALAREEPVGFLFENDISLGQGAVHAVEDDRRGLALRLGLGVPLLHLGVQLHLRDGRGADHGNGVGGNGRATAAATS